MLSCAPHHTYLCCVCHYKISSVGLFHQFDVKHVLDHIMRMTEERYGKHHAAFWSHLNFQFRRIHLVSKGCRCSDDLLRDCPDGHVEEEYDEYGEDRDGDEPSHGGFVIGVSIVPEQLSIGEEIQLSDHFSNEAEKRHM